MYTPLHPRCWPNAYVTRINPSVSAIVSQYLPTCDGLSLILANSPSTASTTPFITSRTQLSMIYSCKINQAQKIDNNR